MVLRPFFSTPAHSYAFPRMNSPLWTNESTTTEDWVTRFTVGDDYIWDRLLLPYDVQATRAHAWGLQQIDILSEVEFEAVRKALDALLRAFENDEITVTPEDEDSHTVIENYVTKQTGDAGRKLHTGRSRNDQVLAALRLYLQDALSQLGHKAAELSRVLCTLSEEHQDIVLPGYTHLQRAMPSTVALWALGYAETLVYDLNVLREARRRVNVSPLGSAAGYGVPVVDLPREAVAERLGFRDFQTHATAAQMTRGKHELEVVHACVQVSATCNRLASDLILYNTTEFGFVDLPSDHCTGSSVMPQKQNPDVLELARGYHHRVCAEMQALATGPSNLPSGYHRDLQLTKGAVLRSLQITSDVLTALTQVLPDTQFRRKRTEAACTPELFATYRALRKVDAGVPFRTAYHETGADLPSRKGSEPHTVLDAYRTAGSPGQERPAEIRARLREQDRWIDADLEWEPRSDERECAL